MIYFIIILAYTLLVWYLETEDWSSKAILAQNRGGRPATYES